jgi:hypothetical protein
MAVSALKKFALALKPFAEHDVQTSLQYVRKVVSWNGTKESDKRLWELELVSCDDLGGVTLSRIAGRFSALVGSQARLVEVLSDCAIAEPPDSERLTALEHEKKRLETMRQLAERLKNAQDLLDRFLNEGSTGSRVPRFTRQECQQIFALNKVVAELISEF